MNYTFSDRISNLAPSAIREILKYSSIPGFIPFAAGNPAPQAFPVKEISKITADIFANDPIDALQYSVTEGHTPLRDTMRSHMKSRHNAGRDFDEIIITSGAQQVMELSAKTLCNKGDAVICENPSFIGSLNAFRSFGLELIGIDMESDGMNIEQLEAALKSNKNVRFIYTIPNFQNPTGVTMSWEKRKSVYALAKKYGVLIVEDNPYGDIRFAGEHIECIKSLDEDGIVIYAGSFSKILSPGMRVGYALAPSPIISKMTVCKQTSDVHTNILAQMIADRFMRNYDFDAHLERIREIYRKKSSLMTGLCDNLFGDTVTYNPIEGGLFIWCSLPDKIDMMDFCRKAAEQKVGVVPGTAFLTDENAHTQNFRMNFSTPTDEQIASGMEILGSIIKNY